MLHGSHVIEGAWLESMSTFDGLSSGSCRSNELLEKVSDNRWWLKINVLLYLNCCE